MAPYADIPRDATHLLNTPDLNSEVQPDPKFSSNLDYQYQEDDREIEPGKTFRLPNLFPDRTFTVVNEEGSIRVKIVNEDGSLSDLWDGNGEETQEYRFFTTSAIAQTGDGGTPVFRIYGREVIEYIDVETGDVKIHAGELFVLPDKYGSAVFYMDYDGQIKVYDEESGNPALIHFQMRKGSLLIQVLKKMTEEIFLSMKG